MTSEPNHCMAGYIALLVSASITREKALPATVCLAMQDVTNTCEECRLVLTERTKLNTDVEYQEILAGAVFSQIHHTGEGN